MINLNRFLGISSIIVFTSFLFLSSAQAQKYKTLSDTTKLNKEFGQISLDIAKLNSKLIEEKSKTAGFHSKTETTAVDAVNTGQDSKEQAAKATNGDTRDTRKSVKYAKKANHDANNAKNAVSDEENNSKKINELNRNIEKKQRQLDELIVQRTAIMTQLNPAIEKSKDSTGNK